MVRKRGDKGGWYHEPPYTDIELLEFYKSLEEPITFVASARPRGEPQAPVQQEPPHAQAPQEPQQPHAQATPRRGSRRGRKTIRSAGGWRGVDRP
jgi:hypothetical protein